MLKYCTINSKREIWDKLKLNEVINYLVFSLILFKILRNIQILSNDNVKLFYVAVFANLIFGTIFLLRKIDIPYVSCDFLRDGFRRLEYKKWYTYFIGLGILGLMILIQNTGFPLREEIYSYGQGGILWLMKRSISDVAFWWSAFWCLWCLFKKNIDEKEKSIFVFIIANILFQSMILAGSGSLDEAFSLTTVSFAMACLVRSRKFKNYIYLFCITVFVIFASITQKQVMAYNWHGWIAMGPDNTGVTYVESKVPGLQGFELDRDTELAYENITSAINVYSLPSDNVYEFPHSPLFNVLCHRKLGTFAVSHFFDVCPDDVFREDFEKIKVNDPKIFIWVELEDSVWLTHEKYYRNGQTLAAREMIPYYEKYIRKAYQQVYRFKNIHVWVKNPTNEQNLEFAKIRLRNSLDLLDDKRFSQMDLDTAADKAMHTMQDGMHYSVSACMNKIIMADDVLYSSLHDADYQFVFHELREWEQKKNN